MGRLIHATLILVLLAMPAWGQTPSYTANGAQSTLASGIAAGATSFTVTTGEGARFPATSSGQFYVTIYNATDYPAGYDDPSYEVVLVTAHTGGSDTFTTNATVNNHNTGGKTYTVVATWTATDYNAVRSALVTFGTPQGVSTTSSPSFAAMAIAGSTASPQITLDGDVAQAVRATTYSDTVNPAFLSRRARGTAAAPRRAKSGDALGVLQFQGAFAADDSTAATFNNNSSTIQLLAREDFTSTAKGTEFAFNLPDVGATAPSTRFKISSTDLTLASGVGFVGTGSIKLWPDTKTTGGYLEYKTENNPIEPGGGSDLHETDVYVFGLRDSVTHYYTGGITLGATNGTNTRSVTSLLAEGNCTLCDGSDDTLRRTALYDHGIDSELLMYQSSTPGYVQMGRNTTGKGLGLLVYGQDINAQATNEVAGLHVQGDFISNDTNVRTYLGNKSYFTLNFGGSNTNKTIHLDDLDTLNTAVTGVLSASTLFRRSYGGNVKASMGIDGSLTMASIAPGSEPAAPAAGFMTAFAHPVGGRQMLASVGPTGLETSYQPFLGRNALAMWLPAGNSTTITAIGAAALTATGTATAANQATTNFSTKIRRLEYLVTVAATTAVAGYRGAASMWTVGGTAAATGGFHFVNRFGPATGVATTTHRSFVGMTASTSAPTDVEPSTLVSMVGAGYDAADTNIQIMHNDGSGTATKVDLGASFPVPTSDRTEAYELVLFSHPGTTQEVQYEFINLATGAVATGTISTNLPTTSTFLSPRGWMSAGGTSSVIGIALMGLYIESDQ